MLGEIKREFKEEWKFVWDILFLGANYKFLAPVTIHFSAVLLKKVDWEEGKA